MLHQRHRLSGMVSELTTLHATDADRPLTCSMGPLIVIGVSLKLCKNVNLIYMCVKHV